VVHPGRAGTVQRGRPLVQVNVAYLVLAHNTPRHLGRLITALSTSSSNFFIHVDKKSTADDYSSIRGDNVRFTPERIPVFWGDFSVVEAILIVLRTALADRRHFDRFVLLSGADHPLRSASYIEAFFEGNRDKEFIDLVAMPCDAAGKPMYRLTTYVLRPLNKRTLARVPRQILMKTRLLPSRRDYRPYLRELNPYGGATWWALSREACDFILAFTREREEVVKFFKNTLLPDESFFHTILGNSYLSPRVVRGLTYADWSAGGPHPAYISEKHLAFFESTTSFTPDGLFGAGEMLFARKFAEESDELVARLAAQIGKGETVPAHM
jgi:hypothetical protein